MDATSVEARAGVAQVVTLDTNTGARGTVAEWVDRFAYVWAAPRSRLDELMALLSHDVVLKAPTTPPMSSGREAGKRAFERAFRGMPDLRAVVHRWSASGDAVFIEMTFHATIGGREVVWDDVDRFLFVDGQAIERVAYFNPAKVRKAFLRNLAGMGQLLRIRSGL